jgi:hypothetical protein
VKKVEKRKISCLRSWVLVSKWGKLYVCYPNKSKRVDCGSQAAARKLGLETRAKAHLDKEERLVLTPVPPDPIGSRRFFKGLIFLTSRNTPRTP